MLHDVSVLPAAGETIERAVIIVHGLGDSASGIIGLGEAFKSGLKNTVFLAPDAPYPCEFSPFGFQWFSANDWTPEVVLKGVKNAAPSLDEYIDSVLEKYALTPDKVALVGFSQGTMMSLYVAPRREKPLACVLGYSGALIGGEELLEERKSAPPVMLIHGEQDDVVPFDAMAHAVHGLHLANIQVESLACPYLAHSIDDRGLSNGLAFLRRAFKV